MDHGAKMRLEALKRDVERKVLEPLRRHAWDASIEQEIERGDYVIVTASRGGYKHRIAVLYTFATANAIYKSIAPQVEQIFYNGPTDQQEQYAYGIDKPVGPIGDFHSTLLDWNQQSTEGKFAAVGNEEEPSPATRREIRRLLSEEPLAALWLRLRQLHSVRLAERVIRERFQQEGAAVDETIVRTKAEGVAFALRNAADYFHTQNLRSVSQRVLNLYYGVLAFAFAEILASPTGAKTLAELENATKLGHGLYTVDGATDDLEHIVVGAISSGFYPTWMKALGLPISHLPAKKPRTYADLSKVSPDSWVTVEQLFASIPEIGDLFADIFESKPRWVEVHYDAISNMGAGAFGPAALVHRAYVTIVDEFGRLAREDVAAFPGRIGEIRAIKSNSGGRHFQAAVEFAGKNAWFEAVDLHHSPFRRNTLIMPILGGVNEYRVICFALLYGLSIVVRYRPGTWRRVQEGDLDHVRALIEAFLAVVERILPQEFLEKIIGYRITANQPGSLFG